jgi:hypothetical protein
MSECQVDVESERFEICWQKGTDLDRQRPGQQDGQNPLLLSSLFSLIFTRATVQMPASHL